MSNFALYLINLDNRPDRLENVRSRTSKVEVEVVRVSAVTGEEIRNTETLIYAPQNNVANWHSHLKVMTIFLQSEHEYCIILEDDVLFINEGIKFLNNLLNSPISEIDILQFGYVTVNGRLDSGQRDSFFRTKARLVRFATTSISLMMNRFDMLMPLQRRLGRKSRILRIFKSNERNLGLRTPIVEGFEAGTHCYLINRKAAEALLNYNRPALMGADLSLIILSVSKSLLIARTTLSFAKQDDTPVSTGEHSRYRFDLGTAILSPFTENEFYSK